MSPDPVGGRHNERNAQKELNDLPLRHCPRLIDLRKNYCIPDSDKPSSGRDLISEGSTNLCTGKWQLSLIELQQPLEVDENTLGSFWTQKPVKKVFASTKYVLYIDFFF